MLTMGRPTMCKCAPSTECVWRLAVRRRRRLTRSPRGVPLTWEMHLPLSLSVEGGAGGAPARMYLHFVKYPSFFCDTCVKRSRTTFSIASVWRSATWLMWRRSFVPFVPISKRVQADRWFAPSRMNFILPNELHFNSDVFFPCSLFRQTRRWMSSAYLACHCRLTGQPLRFHGHIHSSEHYSKRRNVLLSRLLVSVFAMLCWCTCGSQSLRSGSRSRSIAEAVLCTQSGSHGGHKVVMVGMRPFIVRASWTLIPSACPAA